MKRFFAVATAVAMALGLSFVMGAAYATPDNNPDGGGVDRPTSAENAGAQGSGAGTQGWTYHDENNGCGQDKHSGEPRETTAEVNRGWDDNMGWCGKPEEKAGTQGKAQAQGKPEGAGKAGEAHGHGEVHGQAGEAHGHGEVHGQAGEAHGHGEVHGQAGEAHGKGQVAAAAGQPQAGGAVLGAGGAQVLGVQITRPEAQAAVLGAAQVAAPAAVSAAVLAVTGANLFALGLLGIGSLLTGLGLATASARRSR